MPRQSPCQNVIFVLALVLASPQLGEAAIDLSSGFWTTTFNCAEQQQFDGTWAKCDGLQKYGDWVSGDGSKEQITDAANMAAGGGGRGQRHWISPGRNSNSGSMGMCFSSMQPEFWWRFYTRWQAGFQRNAQQSQKLIYSDDSAGRPYIDTYGADGIRVIANNSGEYLATSGVWQTMMGGAASDGKWHEFQFHLKGGSNGGGDIWVDGKLVLHFSHNWGFAGWTCFKYPENLDAANNATTMFQDLDDMAVSVTGYIPPIVPRVGDATPPVAPKNLAIK
jgi:hypothetical protein